MSVTAGASAILAELKREMRRRGVRGIDLADALGVAEPTLRRWLRGQGLTLAGLDAMCDALDIDIRDLIAGADDRGAERLTLAQERVLAADRALALLFFAILNGAQREEMISDFGLPAGHVDDLVRRLHRLGLVDITSSGRLHALTRRGVRWRKGGPLAAAFEKTVRNFFLSTDFGAEDALYVSDMVRLSAAGRQRVLALMDALRDDIHLIAGQERGLGPDRLDWSALFMLVRPLDLEEMTLDLR